MDVKFSGVDFMRETTRNLAKYVKYLRLPLVWNGSDAYIPQEPPLEDHLSAEDQAFVPALKQWLGLSEKMATELLGGRCVSVKAVVDLFQGEEMSICVTDRPDDGILAMESPEVPITDYMNIYLGLNHVISNQGQFVVANFSAIGDGMNNTRKEFGQTAYTYDPQTKQVQQISMADIPESKLSDFFNFDEMPVTLAEKVKQVCVWQEIFELDEDEENFYFIRYPSTPELLPRELLQYMKEPFCVGYVWDGSKFVFDETATETYNAYARKLFALQGE